ncbi:hypothetical protein [Cellulomonas timonensis]|uniref:hypothetical protein n=1 Tax=Cellulomonas timonensis TaxID=1689271 RepID=UPI0011C76062|nr:hypothetical protein [Cellulomonas timonensis]
MHAHDSEMLAICEGFFGDAESIGKRLGLTLYDAQRGGECRYETNTDGELWLRVAAEKPTDVSMFARGDEYFVAIELLDANGNDLEVAADKQESVAKWLQDRANAVEDDYDEWLTTLPAVSSGFAAIGDDFRMGDDNSFDEAEVNQALHTPSAVVRVHSLLTPRHVVVNGEEMVASENRRIIVPVFDVGATHSDASQTYALYFDDVPAGAEAAQALEEVIYGAADKIALSVPKDVKDVTFVVTTGEIAQSVSLLTGEVKDNGESARLATTASGDSAAPKLIQPIVLDPEGDPVPGFDHNWDGTYFGQTAWTMTPWSDQDEWAPAGQSYLILDLEPWQRSFQYMLPPTTADATVAVGGKDYPAVAVETDADSHVWTFLVPEGAQQLNVSIALKLDTARLASRPPSAYKSWGEGFSISQNETHLWEILSNRAK